MASVLQVAWNVAQGAGKSILCSPQVFGFGTPFPWHYKVTRLAFKARRAWRIET